MGYLFFFFFCEIQHSPVDGCSAVSCNFGLLSGEDEHVFFNSAILCLAHQDSETPQRLSQTCVWVSYRGTGQQWSIKRPWALDEAYLSQRLWHKPSWRRSPWTLPYSHWAEQLYQRNSRTVKKVLEPTTDFPTWGSGKGTENSQGIWLWRPMGFDYRTYTSGGNRLL